MDVVSQVIKKEGCFRTVCWHGGDFLEASFSQILSEVGVERSAEFHERRSGLLAGWPLF